MTIKTYEGWISVRSYGESNGVLFLSSIEWPFAEELEWIQGKNVSVRYWIANFEATKEIADEEFASKLLGKAEADFSVAYSDYTGYLWTDEEINVGGHDLLYELKSFADNWLILVRISTNRL